MFIVHKIPRDAKTTYTQCYTRPLPIIEKKLPKINDTKRT